MPGIHSARPKAMMILYTSIFFLFGTVFASFCHLMAERLPKRETLMGQSRCLHCHSRLRLLDVFPILGFVLQQGHCRICGKPIPVSYPLVEILGGLLFSGAFLSFGFTGELLVVLVAILVFLTESISDVQCRTVIDRVWMAGLIPLLIFRIIEGTFWFHLLSAGILFGFLFLVAWLGRLVFKKEALGGGDVKLFLFVGFCVRWPQGILALMIASFFGSIVGFILKATGKEQIPLVPFIFVGTAIAWVFGDAVIAWYLGLLGA